MQANAHARLSLALAIALASCGQDSTRIRRDGREYVRLDYHRSVRAAERVVEDLPSQEEVRARFAGTGDMCHTTDRLDFPHRAGIDLSGYGVIVPYGPPAEDGGRRARPQGFWMRAYPASVEPASVSLDFDLYVPLEWSIESTGSYIDGEHVGEWVFWHPSGELRARGDFDAGKMTGAWRFWTAGGEPDTALSGTYEAGTRTGG